MLLPAGCVFCDLFTLLLTVLNVRRKGDLGLGETVLILKGQRFGTSHRIWSVFEQDTETGTLLHFALSEYIRWISREQNTKINRNVIGREVIYKMILSTHCFGVWGSTLYITIIKQFGNLKSVCVWYEHSTLWFCNCTILQIKAQMWHSNRGEWDIKHFSYVTQSLYLHFKRKGNI